MPAPEPLLDVVVVAYRSRELVRRCLESLADHAPATAAMQVHVVDNASGDGTAELVAERFPDVRLHPLAANTGFSMANNVVLRQSRAPFVLLLNPDTEATAGALDHMLALMAERPDVGMSGCRLVRPDGSFDHAAKRAFPTPLGALAHFAGKGSQYRATDVGEHDVGEVDAVNGAFMLVRREALEQVGLLDEGYWLYMEDLDWCRRFWDRGWKVLYDGTATFVHVKGGTAGAHRALRQNVAFHRGMGRFYRRYEAGRRPLLDAAVYAGIGAKLAVSATRGALARRAGR